jgi:hypothetical protein
MDIALLLATTRAGGLLSYLDLTFSGSALYFKNLLLISANSVCVYPKLSRLLTLPYK